MKLPIFHNSPEAKGHLADRAAGAGTPTAQPDRFYDIFCDSFDGRVWDDEK
ncbi:MAG: hypothetical protein HFI47_01565 [Lachnospiraceae bacterium]|nr:hypothetical protein [Lachnospiraceae bacterium]